MINFAMARTVASKVAVVSALLCAGTDTVYSMQPASSPHAQLDALATTFTRGSITAENVAAMTDAVFALPHFALIQDIPPEATVIIKRKFASAEEAYWKEQHPGVREQDIAAAINTVVADLNLPEYAKTTPDQVHHLRMGMLLQKNPRFMGLRVAKVPIPGGTATILGYMSPLQAYHLILSLIDQKFVDEFYRVTPQEWEQRSHNVPAVRSGPHITTNLNSPRGIEIQERLREAISSVSDAEAFAIVRRALTALGID